MSRNRLVMIERRLYQDGYNINPARDEPNQFDDDMTWLIANIKKKSERVQTLENEIVDFKKLVKYHKNKQKEAEDLNEPYRHRNLELEQRVQELEGAIKGGAVIANVASDEIKELKERVQELEDYAKEYDEKCKKASNFLAGNIKMDMGYFGKNVIDVMLDASEKLLEQNKRYREALEKISSPITSVQFADIFSMKQIARQALEGSN